MAVFVHYYRTNGRGYLIFIKSSYKGVPERPNQRFEENNFTESAAKAMAVYAGRYMQKS